jgi:hypothetical protein
VKGISALRVGRDLGVSHKTADVLLHKIRASLLVSRDWCGYWQGNHRLGESLAV